MRPQHSRPRHLSPLTWCLILLGSSAGCASLLVGEGVVLPPGPFQAAGVARAPKDFFRQGYLPVHQKDHQEPRHIFTPEDHEVVWWGVVKNWAIPGGRLMGTFQVRWMTPDGHVFREEPLQMQVWTPRWLNARISVDELLSTHQLGLWTVSVSVEGQEVNRWPFYLVTDAMRFHPVATLPGERAAPLALVSTKEVKGITREVFQQGFLQVTFTNVPQQYPYRWFDTRAKREQLVNALYAVYLRLPLDAMAALPQQTLPIDVAPDGMNRITYVGDQRWPSDALAWASERDIQVPEVLFADWPRNQESLTTLLLHEAAHVLTFNGYEKELLLGNAMDTELLADTWAVVWRQLAAGTLHIADRSAYRQAFAEETRKQREQQFTDAQRQQMDALVEKSLAAEGLHKGMPEATGAGGYWILQPERFGGYDLLITFSLRNGRAFAYLGKLATGKILRYDSSVEQRLLQRTLPQLADVAVFERVQTCRQDLANRVLSERHRVMPVQLTAVDPHTWEVVLSLQARREGLHNPTFQYVYRFDKERSWLEASIPSTAGKSVPSTGGPR